MFRKFYNLIAALLLWSGALAASETMTIEELLDNEKMALNVQRIYSSNEQLSKEQLERFCSLPLEKLHTLSFWRQANVNDEVINLIVKKSGEGGAFRRLKNLDLSETQITEAGINSLINSEHVATVRELPQLSGRYNRPASTIYIRIEDVKSEFPSMRAFNCGDIKKEVIIHYKNPVNDSKVYEPAKGIKMVELKDY